MTLITEHLTGRASPVHDPAEVGPDDGARIAEYTKWRAFARGEQWPQAAKPSERRLTFNYARALVRKTASYVFPGPVTFSIETPDKTADQSAGNANERILAGVVEALDLNALDLELEIERAICGDAAVKVTWDKTAGRPRVVSVDPATLAATWSPDDPRTPHAISQTYQLPGWALLPYGIDVAGDKQLHTVTEHWTAETWTMTIAGTDYAHAQPNPYGWIPYAIIPNDPHPRQFWGRSDLTDLLDVCRELNREMSVLATIMELSGAPVAVLENVDSSIGITTRPGARWELPADSRAYLLDLLAGQGVRLHVDYIDQLRTTLHDLSETPRTAFGDSGRPLSGAALEVEVQPLLQKVARKRHGWNRFHRERNRMILDLIDTFGTETVAADRTTTTNWPPVLPSDDEVVARTQVQLVAANIRSRQTAMATLGDPDPQGELERVKAELKALQALTQPAEDAPDDGNRSKESSATENAATTP